MGDREASCASCEPIGRRTHPFRGRRDRLTSGYYQVVIPSWRSHMRLLAVVLFSTFSLQVSTAQEIIPGDNLTVRGIPKIPASIAQKVAKYTDFRAATFTGWHPAKREM